DYTNSDAVCSKLATLTSGSTATGSTSVLSPSSSSSSSSSPSSSSSSTSSAGSNSALSSAAIAGIAVCAVVVVVLIAVVLICIFRRNVTKKMPQQGAEFAKGAQQPGTNEPIVLDVRPSQTAAFSSNQSHTAHIETRAQPAPTTAGVVASLPVPVTGTKDGIFSFVDASHSETAEKFASSGVPVASSSRSADLTAAMMELDPQLTAGAAPASELLRLNGFPGPMVDAFAYLHLSVEQMLAIADDALSGRQPAPGSAAEVVSADPVWLMRLTSLASAIRGVRWGAGRAELAGNVPTVVGQAAPPNYEEM
ncbi:hypothetical protein HK405_009267, partial [Cladochytrium tenue]